MYCNLQPSTASASVSRLAGSAKEGRNHGKRSGHQVAASVASISRCSLIAIVAVLIAVFSVSGFCETSAPIHPLAIEEQAVLLPLQTMLDGLAKRDTGEMKSVLLPGGSATMLRGGKPVQLSYQDFLNFLQDQMKATTSVIAEPINQPIIHIDDDLAVIWAPYKFLVDGKVEHCGTDIVTLARVQGQWLISSLEDNARTSCGDH